MATKKPITLLSSLLFLLLSSSCFASSSPDIEPLLHFKFISDTSNTLTTWNTTNTTNPCSWTGVSCLKNNRVYRLVLENLNLHNSFSPLSSLSYLRVLSLKRNSFSGPLPHLSNFTSLKLLFLSHNLFSGPLSAQSLSSLSRLYRLDLSYNNFSGQIPVDAVNGFTHLLTLRLERNRFTGSVSGLNLPSLQDFNVSGNLLFGEIPKSLSGFPASSFGENPGLCGPPVLTACKGGVVIGSDPTRPGSAGAIASKPGSVISSSPSALPSGASPNGTIEPKNDNGQRRISPIAVIAIVVGDCLVLAIVVLLLFCYFWRRYAVQGEEEKRNKMRETEKIVYSSSPYPNYNNGSERAGGKMVFFEGVRRFELEDLLRASAEMLGKGGFGTAYKAVLDDGSVVAVKRLKDAVVGGGGGGSGGWRREFEQQMEVLGRLKHPNLVALKAYYFAREEKLLVYEFMPNGSLFWLLHGNRGPGRTPLDWTTRLKIAAGAARGVAFIHSTCKSLKLVHGNIKSTNVLLDKSGNARVSDFGLTLLTMPSPPLSSSKSNGYCAPEQLPSSDLKKHTQKSDVYSFGVLLLEILTGKCPSVVDCGGYGSGGGGVVDLPRWVQSVVREEWTAEVFDLELMRFKDIEEEMVGLLQIALACTSASPDQRPRMGQVVKMVEELRGVDVSPCHDSSASLSDSPCLSEDVCGATSH